MKSFNILVFIGILLGLLISACVTQGNSAYNTNTHESLNRNPSGTPSPLNTSTNPWTQINPQAQVQYQAARQGAR